MYIRAAAIAATLFVGAGLDSSASSLAAPAPEGAVSAKMSNGQAKAGAQAKA